MTRLTYFVFIILAQILVHTVVYGQKNKETKTFNLVAFGDMPYTLPTDYGRFENLIKKTNQQNQIFNIHVGDIKASKTDCSDSIYKIIYNYFKTIEKPLIYTPGDNEWTDCNKAVADKYDIEERLNSIRKLFFNGTTSLGKTTMPLISQSLNPKFSMYIENNRWEYNTVSFASLHVVGTNNNFVTNKQNNNDEFYKRNEADIAWLNEVFDNAEKNNNPCVVLIIHADMYGDKDIGDGSGFTQFKSALRDRVKKFKKPVLLINGDSHVFLVDKPMKEPGKSGAIINNFTRLQVFGENDVHAVKITIDPTLFNPFIIEQLIIEGN